MHLYLSLSSVPSGIQKVEHNGPTNQASGSLANAKHILHSTVTEIGGNNDAGERGEKNKE